VTGKRIFIIGLDGATFDLIEPWARGGFLPNLARLMQDGSRGHLLSTLHPLSAPAWATFLTGVNQGKHGLYDAGAIATISKLPTHHTFVLHLYSKSLAGKTSASSVSMFPIRLLLLL
jgi:predicted AlkP superfamily phosphohydrolase/phosphomutase